jgi:hypothetical protein
MNNSFVYDSDLVAERPRTQVCIEKNLGFPGLGWTGEGRERSQTPPATGSSLGGVESMARAGPGGFPAEGESGSLNMVARGSSPSRTQPQDEELNTKNSMNKHIIKQATEEFMEEESEESEDSEEVEEGMATPPPRSVRVRMISSEAEGNDFEMGEGAVVVAQKDQTVIPAHGNIAGFAMGPSLEPTIKLGFPRELTDFIRGISEWLQFTRNTVHSAETANEVTVQQIRELFNGLNCTAGHVHQLGQTQNFMCEGIYAIVSELHRQAMTMSELQKLFAVLAAPQTDQNAAINAKLAQIEQTLIALSDNNKYLMEREHKISERLIAVGEFENEVRLHMRHVEKKFSELFQKITLLQQTPPSI